MANCNGIFGALTLPSRPSVWRPKVVSAHFFLSLLSFFPKGHTQQRLCVFISCLICLSVFLPLDQNRERASNLVATDEFVKNTEDFSTFCGNVSTQKWIRTAFPRHKSYALVTRESGGEVWLTSASLNIPDQLAKNLSHDMPVRGRGGQLKCDSTKKRETTPKKTAGKCCW